MESMMDLTLSDAVLPPTISKGEYERLGDAPDLHRWRAMWYHDTEGASSIGLVAYPVIKVTRKGAWISKYADFRMTRWIEAEAEYGFAPWKDWMGRRLVFNGSRSSWAKPTQEEAIYSLAVRLHHWANNVENDVKRVRSAAAGLSALRPDLQRFADWAIESVGSATKSSDAGPAS